MRIFGIASPAHFWAASKMAAHHTAPHTPHNCWLVTAARDNDTTGNLAAHLVLDDLADALAAYERISAVRTNTPVAHIPCTRLTAGATGVRRDAPAAPDALVLAGAVTPDTAPDDILAHAVQQIARTTQLPDNACVWSIVLGAGDDVLPSRKALLACRAACSALGARWCGGLMVPNAAMLPALMRSPRLGAFRRPLSESIDRLIAALRLGRPIDELDRMLDGAETPQHDENTIAPAGIIEVPKTLSWKLFARLH